MAMAKQLAKLSWKSSSSSSMLKWCYLSTHSGGTTPHLPVPVPKWRSWEGGMSKPWSLVQQEPTAGIQSGRPVYSPPAIINSDSPAAADLIQDDDDDGLPFSPDMKYVSMGLLRPWSIWLESYQSLGLFSPEFYKSMGKFKQRGIQDDGTPAPRWWELKFKKPWRLPPGISDDDRPAPQLCNVGSISNWEGRLKRWKLDHTFRPYPNYSVEDIVAHRVFEIAEYFRVPQFPDDFGVHTVNVEQFEYWLDEVEGYFEFMDIAHELHSVDRLFPLLHHVLVHPRAACIRAKTAELVTTMVHNNPRSQQLVMELHGLQPLWYNFTSDPDATSRTKALGAISALIRNNEPGITAFRETNGYAALGDALSSENVMLQREALNLIQYLLHENSSDCVTVTELGLPCIMMHLASSDDAEVRVAALRGLLLLARYEEGTYKNKRDKEGGNGGHLVKNDDKLKQGLQELIKRISAMAPEDLVAAREEIQLVDSLWNACYNEPSSLNLFDEPSPGAWAAADPKLPIEPLLV